jgi:hypothetical protein
MLVIEADPRPRVATLRIMFAYYGPVPFLQTGPFNKTLGITRSYITATAVHGRKPKATIDGC